MSLTYGVNPPTSGIITVAAGTGAKQDTQINGKGMGVGIVAPSAAATYDFEIVDCDGFLVVHGEGLVGNTTIENNVRFYGAHVLTISNATVDGDYRYRIWHE